MTGSFLAQAEHTLQARHQQPHISPALLGIDLTDITDDPDDEWHGCLQARLNTARQESLILALSALQALDCCAVVLGAA